MLKSNILNLVISILLVLSTSLLFYLLFFTLQIEKQNRINYTVTLLKMGDEISATRTFLYNQYIFKDAITVKNQLLNTCIGGSVLSNKPFNIAFTPNTTCRFINDTDNYTNINKEN